MDWLALLNRSSPLMLTYLVDGLLVLLFGRRHQGVLRTPATLPLLFFFTISVHVLLIYRSWARWESEHFVYESRDILNCYTLIALVLLTFNRLILLAVWKVDVSSSIKTLVICLHTLRHFHQCLLLALWALPQSIEKDLLLLVFKAHWHLIVHHRFDLDQIVGEDYVVPPLPYLKIMCIRRATL